MKDFSLTKDELEKRLRELDRTRDGFEPTGIFAMCYSPAMMVPGTVQRICAQCGKRFEIKVIRNGGDDDSLSNYEQLAEEYRSLGYDARIACYCDECARDKPLLFDDLSPDGEKTNVFFAFKAQGAADYHLAPLRSASFDESELLMVLEFLKGARSYQELDQDYESLSLFETSDGFKKCIERILGLEG